ncbi:MAG: hypothetical protein J6S19_08400, partial [Lentisphaeria bacterium]|nr:hypothetical protein [Lentisphaeria bacterium]
IEIFMFPAAEPSSDRNIREHKQFVFNVSGCRYEQASRGGIADTKWDLPWQAAVKRSSKGYTAEVYIPYYVMSPAANAKTWRFNIGREDINKKSSRHDLSIWSASKQIAENDNFGYLCNIPVDFSQYQAAFQGAKLSLESAEGSARSVVSGVLNGRQNGRYSVKVAVLTKDKKVAAFNAVEKVLPKSGEMRLDIPLALNKSGEYTLQTIVTDDSGKIVAFDEKPVAFSAASLVLDMVQPCYRNNIYLALPNPALELNIRSLAAAADLKGADLTVTVTRQGKTIAQKSFNAPKAAEKVVFNAANWQPGTYSVECVLANAGKSSGKLSAVFNVIARGKGNIVTLDRDRHVLVNGKRTLVIGIYHAHNAAGAKNSANAGINAAQTWAPKPASYKKVLDIMAANKLYANCVLKNINGKKLEDLYNTIKDHPAVFSWDIVDEPAIRSITPEKIMPCVNQLRSYKSGKPLRISFSDFTVVKKYQKCYDMPAVHKYVLPFDGIAAQSQVVRAVVNNIAPGQSPQITLQSWIHWYDETQRPQTAAQTRSIAYISLINGAKGLWWYDYPVAYKVPHRWDAGKAINAELFELEDIILGKRTVVKTAPATVEAAVFTNGSRTI